MAQPPSMWAMTAFVAIATLGVGLFLMLGSYTRRSTVIGQLVPMKGLATVLAPATGVIAELDSAEGKRVLAGQSLAVVSLPRATIKDGDTTIAMTQRLARRQQGLQDAHRAQGQLLDAQAGGLAAQLDTARRELAQLEQEIATRQGQVRIADETLQRLRQLQIEKYVSALQVKQQEAEWLQAVSDVQALQRQVSTLRRSLTQLQQTLHELPGQHLANDASFQRDLAALEQEQVETEARGALVISAPVTGVIATQLVKLGQSVQAGQPLMSLLPDGRLEAELLVPSRAIGFIAPGDKVLLRYQAYPYQKFGHQRGTVSRVSRSALSHRELQTLLAGETLQGEASYRVTVRLAKQIITAYGKPEQLKPGMLLEADIQGEKRRLIEWLFEPLYSLRGKFGSN